MQSCSHRQQQSTGAQGRVLVVQVEVAVAPARPVQHADATASAPPQESASGYKTASEKISQREQGSQREQASQHTGQTIVANAPSGRARGAGSAPTPTGKAGHTSPQKKPGVLPNFLARAGSSNGDTSSPQGTPTSKKSTAYDKPGMLLPHMPSGARIPAKYFPLANVLLFEREKGHQYSTDAYLFPIVSKHKHIGSQFKTSDAFAEYLNGAQRDEVVTLEPGFKPGTRHVRLAERLHDPREKEASRNGERLPPAGADPYTSSPPRQNAASSASASEVSSAGPVMTKEPVTIEEPSVEDRKRFKPLMDIMFALRKHEPA